MDPNLRDNLREVVEASSSFAAEHTKFQFYHFINLIRIDNTNKIIIKKLFFKSKSKIHWKRSDKVESNEFYF